MSTMPLPEKALELRIFRRTGRPLSPTTQWMQIPLGRFCIEFAAGHRSDVGQEEKVMENRQP